MNMLRFRTLAVITVPAEKKVSCMLSAGDSMRNPPRKLSHPSVPCKDGHAKEKTLGLRDLHIVYKSFL
jgi:hypothetical protein